MARPATPISEAALAEAQRRLTSKRPPSLRELAEHLAEIELTPSTLSASVLARALKRAGIYATPASYASPRRRPSDAVLEFARAA